MYGIKFSITSVLVGTSLLLNISFSISAKKHDHLVIYSVGAYGYSMASNYNSRLRAAEYLVDGSEIIEIRKAESYEDLIKLEQY